MANWQDRPVTFNQYVEQQPVTSMAQVGMQKQQQYNEGITKIQSQIDSVAGLDVIRDVDKNYLQSKLNELGSNLKTVAAGDFSNYQLVNSVGGMTNQIVKDKNVVNAVSSTTHHRKQLQLIDEARSKGEWSPENEFNYQKQFGVYYNSNKVGDQFSGRYTPYFDVDKYTKETFNSLKPGGYTIDQIFQTDESGNPIKKRTINSKTGKVEESYELSTTMSKLKKEGLFPEKVRQAIDQIFSNPKIAQQLQITGEYNYQSYSPEQLGEKIGNLKAKQLMGYDDLIKELNIKKSIAPNTEKNSIQEKIDKLNETKTRINSQYSDLISSAYSNPDAIRGLIHKDEVRDNYMSMFTSTTEERTIHANPGWQANFEMQKEANDLAMRREDMSYKWATLKQADEHFNLSLQQSIAKDTKEEGGKVPTQQGIPSNEDITRHFDDNYAKAASVFSTATDNLLFNTGVISSSTLEEYKKQFPDKPIEDIKKAIIVNEARKEQISPEEYRTKWYNKALLLLENNPELLNNNPALRDVKNSAENAQRLFSEYTTYKKKIDGESIDPNTIPLQGISPITVNIDGKQRVLSPELQLDVALASIYSVGTFSPDVEKRIGMAREKLKNLGLDKLPKAISMEYLGKEATDNLKKIQSSINTDFSKNIDKRAAAIKSVYQMNPILGSSIITGEPKIDKQNLAYISTLVSTYKDMEQNLSSDFVGNAADINKIILKPEEGSIRIKTVKNEVTGEIVPKLVFSDTDANIVGEMSITSAEASNLGHDVSSWYKSPDVKLAEMRMNVIGNGTSSRGNIEDVYTYKTNDVIVNKRDLPNLAKIPQVVKGNIKEELNVNNDGTTSKLYYNYIYVNDKGKEFVVPLPEGKPSVGEALQYFKRLTPQAIQILLSEQTPK